ncbi:MAG: D-hexose-6-phosphate mutarotase [Verrucomicrobia bacterium]|nr:D-hexose-6-phosphate mutarotase [Verrucomicrobiota bacterium]
MQNLPDTVRVETGRGGLRRVMIGTPQAEAEIYLHGAHVARFQPREQKPVLFMSEKSWFESGKPIRGGVPLCFPWFGPRQDGRPGPGHGFARLLEWELATATQTNDGEVEIGFRLVSNEATRREWNGDFEMNYQVRIGAALGMELRVRNASRQPMRIEEALHTYLAVSDVRKVHVEGLAGTTYMDTVGTPCMETEGAAPICIAAETDRIYMNTRATCVIHDPDWKRRLMVEKTGSDATVVWNPWIAKAKAMPDFGDDEWPFMLCIETCNVREHPVTLAPGQSHSMGAVIRAENVRTANPAE